jgi:hypothetical protein
MNNQRTLAQATLADTLKAMDSLRICWLTVLVFFDNRLMDYFGTRFQRIRVPGFYQH